MRAEREDEGLTQGAPRDMRGHYPAGLAESVRAVRAYRAEHPESADVLDRLNRAVYGYRRNNGWNVPLLSREGERLQGVRTALPDDGASEAVVGGGRGLTPDAGADANAAALQGLPESAAVASGNAPTHQQNLQVRTRAEGAAPGLPASENLAGTDGGKRAPVAGKRPDTVLPVLNPQVAASAVKVSSKKLMADAAADFTRRLAADRRKLEKAGVPLGDGEYRFEHTNRKHIDALAGVLDRLGKGGMLEEFADMAGSSNSDGLVFDGRRYLKGKEAETLQAGGLLEAVPSKSGWDYRLTQEGRALTKVMVRSRDAAADGKPAGRAQSARAKDTPVAGKAAVAKNATTEKPSSDKAAEPETLVKTALDNPEEAERKTRVLQGEPVYTVKERQAPQGFKALREWAAALFEKAGGKAVNPDAGEILLNERSVRDSIAHGMNPFKAEAFAAIPDVISQGVVIHEGVNPENGARYVYISAPVEIEGKDDVVTLLARNTGNGSQMYLHSVATKESILNASDTETAEISRETGKVNSGYIASVLKKLLEYKTETGKGVSVGKKQQKRQAESEAGSVPSEAQPKSGKDYFGLSLYESGQDYKGISEAHYRKFVAELSKLDGWRVNNRKYGKLEFRVDGEEVVFLRRLESLYSEHAVIGFSVYNSRLVEKKFDEIEFVFNPSEPPKETAERLNRFIRSIYPVSEASVQVESNPESEADTHRTPESVRAFSVTLPKLQQKRAVEHLTADALLDGGAKYPQLNGRTTKAGQVEKTLSAGFVPYEEIREQTARMGKERDKMFFKLHREAYGEDSSFDYDNSDDAELKAQTDEALREKYPPKTVYLMKHKQSGDALPITKTQFDYAVYLENMPSEGLRFSRAAKQADDVRDLMVTHNISGRGILHAARMGGLPFASVAVTRQSNPLYGFGEVTLIGNRDYIDPKGANKAKVFGSDIYSPRYPSVSYEYDRKDLQGVVGRFKQAAQAVGDVTLESAVMYESEGRGLNEVLSRSLAVKYQFLKDGGIDVSPVMKSSGLGGRAVPETDYFETLAKVDGLVEGRASEFERYVEDVADTVPVKERLYQGISERSGKRLYKPHTLENVVKKLKKDIRGGESAHYGLPSLRARVTPKFKSVDDIRKNKGRLVSSEDFAEAKAEIEAESAKLAQAVGVPEWEIIDVVGAVVDDGATVAFERYGIANTAENGRAVAGFIAKLKAMPTEYFEGKAKDVTQFSDFVGAVVPSDLNVRARKVLEDAGLKLYEYDAAKAGARAQAVKLATDELDAVRGDILFSLDESPGSAFARAVDDAARGRQVSGYVRVGTTPDVLKMLGLPDVRVTVHGSMFKKVMGGKHSVTAEDLKQIPKQINSPVAVMKSETMADGYVVLTELVEHERGIDKPVVAALHLKRTKDGLELMNIASVYGRRDIQVQRGLNSHLLYLDKEKGLKLSRTFGLQLPAYVQEGSNLGSQVKTDSDLAQYLKAEKQGKFDKKQENAKQHAESIKKRLAESIGGLAEQVDVAAVSETAPDKAQMLLSERVEGWFDGRTGKITLVAGNLTPERAVWVAWHELGHRGFAAEGFAKYREELERADGNSLIRRIADAVQEEREGTGDAAASVRSAAVEEAIVELYAAQRTGDWSGIENRYGVKVGNGLKRGIAGVLARIGALLRRVLQRLTGKADGAMSDADVFAMLADLHGNVEGARDAVSDGNHRAVMFARAEDGAAERSKSESLEKLRRAETIRISGREIPEGGNLREYKRNALEYGKSLRGSYVNKDTGREITLGASGVKEVLQHDYKDAEHLQSIAAIPQIIENAVYIDTLPNEDGKVPHIKEFEYYLAGLNIGGTDYTVRAAVGVSDFGDRYYDHKLTQIEKGKLLEARHSDNKSGVPQQQNALGNFDDKRLLQILQDKDAGKGGIADFDTEAVRFSRAANIGAAISHITGKKSDLRNALKDRWDASKGIQLQFLGRRQIEDIYGGDLDGLKEYGRLSELFGADANKAVTEADKVVREWGRLKKADAKALADLMHDATLAKVDADPLMRGDAQKRLDGIRTALDIADGKIVKAKAVIASADARIARADAVYNKASEAAKKAQSALLAAEEKAGREILADEADMRLRRLFYADSEAKRALRHAEADVMAESRAKTDAVQMLKQARADVRRLEKDEVEAQKALEGLALLNRRFAKLPDAAQKVYRKARDDYRAHFGQVRDAIAERLARSGQDAEIVRRLKERFDNELGGVYFPLARFGDYLVVVKDADGNNVNVSRAETLSEAEKLRDALKADFGAGFKVSPVMKSRDYIQSRDAVSGGFMKELGEAVGMLDLDPAQQAQLNDTLTQLYLNSLPDTSWAKHGIHRKGVPGFSDDARRAYAQNMGSGANYLAKLRYADRMAEQLDVMQDFVDGRKYEEGFNQRQLQRVADEMRKRHEAVMNPNPSKLAQALTGFGFLWMMGMSPASAIVNLSQTAMVAYPVMAAKWGYADAARELLRASKQIGLKVGEKFNTIEDSLNEDEKAAFQKAVDYGVIDLSQAHDLAGVANGDPGLAGSAWQKVMDKASWLFHHAEKFNRQVTFVAAYRLAKRAGADSDTAFEQAKKATYDGHFDYAAQNRPRFMMGNVAKVVFLFKQYSQNILYALGRNAYLAFKGDKEARKTLAGLLVSHAMASGILGLPFVSALLAVASMLGSDDDDPWIPSATCCTASPCPASKPT